MHKQPFSCFKYLHTENCTQEFNSESGDEFMSKVKSTNSSYCLLRHNRSTGQATRGNERISSGGSSYNSAMQEKSTDSTNLTSSSSNVNRSKMVNNWIFRNDESLLGFIRQELSRQKSPIFNRRRASSITLARTIPNFGASSPTPATINSSPAHNPELYRYIKSEEQQQRQNPQQWSEQSHSNR